MSVLNVEEEPLLTFDQQSKEECAYIGCHKKGHLSQRLSSSMFSYRYIVCDEHERLLT